MRSEVISNLYICEAICTSQLKIIVKLAWLGNISFVLSPFKFENITAFELIDCHNFIYIMKPENEHHKMNCLIPFTENLL